MGTPTNSQNIKDFRIFLILLAILGFVLILTSIRGTFTIDESNYLVTVTGLRSGSLFVPGTEGLSPSKELFYFDPEPFGRHADRTPVYSVAPPLYSLCALPFSYLGWRGLVLLNTLSYLLIAVVVFVFVRRHAGDRRTPWIAAALTLFGGYSIEYAQGLWPHMFSAFLVVSAVYFLSRVWEGGGPRLAVLGGLLIGAATGIREQNIILLACLGATLLIYSNRRLASLIWFGLGSAVPLAAIATFHFLRQGIWHPFPKAIAFSERLTHVSAGGASNSHLQMLLGRIFDSSYTPPVTDSVQSILYRKELASGAVLIDGVVKKALIQSSPWIAAAFVILVLIWIQRNSTQGSVSRSLRALSMVAFPFLVFMTFISGNRTDGIAYNQRYFLEIIPLMAVALAFALDGVPFKTKTMTAGLFGGGIAFALVLMLPSRPFYHLALLRVPVFMGLLLAIVWVFRSQSSVRAFLSMMIGLCLGWSLFAHVFDDLSASRARRSRNAAQLTALESTIPEHSALFAYWGAKDAAGPLQLSRDVVILDVAADEGADAARLTHELQHQERRVFVMGDNFPDAILRNIAGQDSLSTVRRDTVKVYEVIRKEKNGGATLLR